MSQWIEQLSDFGRRQFDSSPTRWQNGFDFTFGILTPIVCLLIDPQVFTQGSTPSDPGLSGWRVFAFTAVAGGALALISLWLSRGRSGWVTNGVVFPFGVAALAALLIGWKPAVMSIVALVFYVATALGIDLHLFVINASILGLAVLGLTPLFTSFVYLRTAVRAAEADLWRRGLFGSVKTTIAHNLGVILMLGVPAGLQHQANHYVQSRVDVILQSPQPHPVPVAELKAAFWCTPACYWNIARQYEWASGEDRKQRLADIYFELTGLVLQPNTEQFQD